MVFLPPKLQTLKPCRGLPGFTHLLRVKTKGVAPLEPRSRATDCSVPSLEGSPPAPPPEKGHPPLDLDPLPPILRDEACRGPMLAGGPRNTLPVTVSANTQAAQKPGSRNTGPSVDKLFQQTSHL